ncbi:hypothetical protein F2Q69_00040035 [Brassica cretica]|uniref:Uncharacterized protein n=1 Tax=Brassica cretica TaxID=69181 RepID=A0A8S9NBW7_BRACR|nr:hypothetical protein F2Q69_00040035 [Brassica cretica]
MPGGVPKLPKIQPADIQAAVGWGVAAAAGAIWVVQIYIVSPPKGSNFNGDCILA